jgi:ribose transport system substrate-binding protein
MPSLQDRRLGSARLAIALALASASLLTASCGSGSAHRAGPVVSQAQVAVSRGLSSNEGYGGPANGPRAQHAKRVVFVAADITNGGIAGVATGVEQAARAIGWKLTVLDGQSSVAGRARAMAQALALRPTCIILGGFDATEQPAALRKAAAHGIPVVGWHAGPAAGPEPAAGLFTNVTTDPIAVARLAAQYVIARSEGHAGVVIFYDSEFQIAVEKARVMAAAIRRCRGCAVLATVNLPIAQAEEQMAPALTSLVERYGRRLSYMLAVNGNYFAGSRAALLALGRSGTDPPYGVAAGDGDASEFERIRSGDYQTASVAEPLYLQGWQLIDELNRALARRPPSGYAAPPRLITRANVPSGGVFDPSTPYRADYRRIWGR